MGSINFSTAYPIIATITTAAGMFGGIYALLKLRPEAGQMTVIAAQGAVVAQTGVIDTLRQEMTRIAARVDSLESERTRLVEEAAKLRVENLGLRERVLLLEEEVARLRRAAKEREGN